MKNVAISLGFIVAAVSGCGAGIGSGDGSSQGALGAGGDVEAGQVGEGEGEGAGEIPPGTPAPSDGCSATCGFDRYNLDVQVGDVFVVQDFLTCSAFTGVSFAMDGGSWDQLAAINAAQPITISDVDRQGGNHGDGEYRLNIVDAQG